MTYYEKFDIGGSRFSTGLLVPQTNVSHLPRYAAAGPVWTKDQILESLRDRQPRREIFGDDWIKNQNGVGACAGYAAASALERARHRAGHDYVELSGDGIYAAVNGGSDRGSMLDDNMMWLSRHGIPPASMVRRHEYRKNRISQDAYREGERFKGFEAYFLETEIELASALVNDFFCAVAVHAGNGGRAPDGMIDWQNGVGNHCVVADDLRYRNGRFEFEIANSWALRWGERGRGFLTWRGHLSRPIQYHKFYAIRSATADPEGDNPPVPQG